MSLLVVVEVEVEAFGRHIEVGLPCCSLAVTAEVG